MKTNFHSTFLTLLQCLSICLYSDFIKAQQKTCGTDQFHQHLLESDPRYAESFQQHETMLDEAIQSPGLHKERQVFLVPVVFHVIHMGEQIGTGSNISDQKIYEALNALNIRFANYVGTGVDVGIRFTTATRDPYGCATDGINRVNGLFVFDYYEYGIGYGGAFCNDNDAAVKDLSRWPTLEYLNIWVVHKACGGWLSGYALLPGMNANPYDGVVIIGDEMNHDSHTLTHEVGHALNLYHTFEGSSGNQCPIDTSCTINGDKICDTPPHKQSDCDKDNPCTSEGNWDNSRYNYMSYCDPLVSMGRFTEDQKTRILATMDVFPRQSLRYSRALDDPDSICMMEPFITTWDTRKAGLTPFNKIYFPGKGINYTIQWESVLDTSVRGSVAGVNETIVTFPDSGIYRIKVTPGNGTFEAMSFNDQYDRLKLISIDQWGDISWSNMENAFSGCSNMTCPASDTPNLFNVTSMLNMFNRCTLFNGNIGNWWTGNVRTMESAFNGARNFNQDISQWNTSNVWWMQNMFRGATAFNQPLENWNIENVLRLDGMFYQATSFNQPIGQWNTQKVRGMREMFYDADAFNQDIGDWNTSSVTDLSLMFEKTKSFNQDISRWNTSNLLFLLQTFKEAEAFNQDISGWNTSKVSSMILTFYKASSFNQNLGNWKLKENVNMLTMLSQSGLDCDNYSGTLIGWQVNNPNVLNRNLSATSLEYGTNAEEARNALIQLQQWTINGDDPSGVNCEPCILSSTITSSHTTCGIDNGAIALDASGSGELFYNWNTGDTISVVQNLRPGIYSVTIGDQNGCMLVLTDTIESSEALSIEFVYNVPQLIAIVDGATEPISYVWSTGDTTNTIEPMEEGEYIVTVTDAEGCQVIDSSLILFSSVFIPSTSFRVYPNPVQYDLFIESFHDLRDADITLSDLDGRVIRVRQNQQAGKRQLNVTDLPKGTYLLRIRAEKEGHTFLIIKI